MNNHIILIIEVTLSIFICWQFREKIKVVIIDAIRQVQLKNYLSGKERRQLAELRNNNNNMLIDHSNDGLLKDAYRCLSQATINRKKNKITIIVPTMNYPEIQEYIQAKLDQHLLRWLEGNYPGHHWT
ncbi:hypothetical protein NP061_010000, partial [Weissella confusa]|nr:hypothetical protein [Weissella confusa]